jgi:antitoxin YefM
MYAHYKLKASELDSKFLDAVQDLFQDREIEISVCETAEEEEDETAYLLRSPANRERLLKAIENVAREENLVTVDLDAQE